MLLLDRSRFGVPFRDVFSILVALSLGAVLHSPTYVIFFCKVGPHLDLTTQVHWSIALYLSFKIIMGYLGVQPPYCGLQSRSASLLLFVPDPTWQSPRSASLSFPMLGIRIECVLTFPFLYHISYMRESLLSSPYAACTADWYTRLRPPPTFCNVSCLVYLWTKHTYQLVPPDTIDWSHTFHRLSILCFLLSIQFLILDLNLLNYSARKGSGLISLVLAPSLTSLSAVSFGRIPLALVPTLWLPGLFLTELSSFLYSPLEAVILYHWLLGLQLLLGCQRRLW